MSLQARSEQIYIIGIMVSPTPRGPDGETGLHYAGSMQDVCTFSVGNEPEGELFFSLVFGLKALAPIDFTPPHFHRLRKRNRKVAEFFSPAIPLGPVGDDVIRRLKKKTFLLCALDPPSEARLLQGLGEEGPKYCPFPPFTSLPPSPSHPSPLFPSPSHPSPLSPLHPPSPF